MNWSSYWAGVGTVIAVCLVLLAVLLRRAPYDPCDPASPPERSE